MVFISDFHRLRDSFVRTERSRTRTNDVPVITDEGATIEDGGRVSSVQKVYVQANISNQYGAFYAQVKYDVKWTDKNGVEHTEQKSTNAYYFKATSDTVFYEAIIPATESRQYGILADRRDQRERPSSRPKPSNTAICAIWNRIFERYERADSPARPARDSEEPNSNILSNRKKIMN